MEGTERLVRTWMASGRDQDVEGIVAGIVAGESTLINVVKALGEYLTAEEDEIRTKGVELLSLVITRCPSDKFSRQSVRTLLTFYIGKLEDLDTIIPALKGLLPLSKLAPFTSEDAVDVFKAMTVHVKMRSLVQGVRFTVFSILDSFMSRHRDALKSLGSEFISGYIRLAEGEKDPRNLMLAFAIDRVIGVEFDISNYVEAFFDIVVCYFPISFRPPPEDQSGITAEDLRKSLRYALASTPIFGPLAMPLFIEKLMMGSPAAKRDTLHTLSAALPVYGAGAASNHSKKLWDYLRLEIFQPSDDETASDALITAQVLIQTLYPTRSSDSLPKKEDAMEEDVTGIAAEIVAECLKLVSEPEKSQSTYAVRVLSAFLSTTPSVVEYTVAQTVPHLLKVFRDPDEAPNRRSLLVHLAAFVDAARQSPLAKESGKSLLEQSKDEVLGAFTTGLKSSAGAPALEGLKSMVLTPDLLTDDETRYIVHSVDDMLSPFFSDSDTPIEAELSDEASDGALSLFLMISTSPAGVRHVETLTLPMLFSVLPDTPCKREDEARRQRAWRVLEFLGRLCVSATLFDTLVVRLLAKVDLSLSRGTAEEDKETGVAYAHAALHTIATVLEKKVGAKDADVSKHMHRLVPHLFSLFVGSALSPDGSWSLASEARLVRVAGRIVGYVVQASPAPEQTTLLKTLFSTFLEGKVDQLLEPRKIALAADAHFAPLEHGAPQAQQALVPLFTAALVPLLAETTLPVADLSSFLHRLLWWGVKHGPEDVKTLAAYSFLTSAVNKHADDLPSFLATAPGDCSTTSLDTFWLAYIVNREVPTSMRTTAIHAWAHVARALVVRNHKSAITYAERLFTLFGDTNADVVAEAARAVGEIPAANTVLTKANHAVIRMLYAQKYCVSMLPRLLEGAKVSGEAGQQRPHLIALTSLVKSVPNSIYVDRMPSLMPLLLRGLDLPEPEIRASIIDTLHSSAAGGSQQPIVAEHAPTLIAAMLTNSRAATMPSSRVRVAALRYLGLIPAVVPYSVIHPHRALVLKELLKVLDDPKKAARKEAVDARSTWYTKSG